MKKQKGPEGERIGPDEQVLYHELVHQILDLAHDAKFASRLTFLRARQNEQPCFWAIEGIACFFETCELQGMRLVPTARNPRYARFAKGMGEGRKPGLASWIRMGQKEFMAEDQALSHYDQAAALTHFLLHYASGQKYRRSFFLYLSDHYRGQAGEDGFQKAVKTRLDVLEGEFADYVKKTWPAPGAGNE